MSHRTLCQRFGAILNGSATFSNRVCVVTGMRDINARILGRRTRSLLVLPQLFSFESLDSRGRALNLGETVILQREINPFVSALRKRGIIVTAIHNHWLFEKPRLMYIHFESIDRPLDFARKVREALRVLS